MELEIECLWHTDASRAKEAAGLDIDPTELDNRTMTFYDISAIAPSEGWSDGIQRCTIHIPGDKFASAYSYEDTKEMIRKSKNKLI